jgi:L-threonylcarbamoyladenylate synthase
MLRLLPKDFDRISLGNSDNLYDVAKNIFSFLRLDFDTEKKCRRIICQGFSNSGIGLAIMNRLRKAADIILE